MQTPVLYLIFNRPEAVARSFAAIRQARPPRLYIGADGPRADKQGEAEKCRHARELAANVDWPCEVFTLFRNSNLGTAKAVSSALTWFFEHEPEGIVLEDDCVPHPDFFPFCSALLEKYRKNERISIISGLNTQFGQAYNEYSYYFSRSCMIWGWAGWARSWRLYDPAMNGLEKFIKNQLPQIIRNPATLDFYSAEWRNTAAGKIDSWAYRLEYSMLANHKLSIIPNANLVGNIGFGGSSSHTGRTVLEYLPLQGLGQITHPPKVEICEAADDFYHNLLSMLYNEGILEFLTDEGTKRLLEGNHKSALLIATALRQYLGPLGSVLQLQAVAAATAGNRLLALESAMELKEQAQGNTYLLAVAEQLLSSLAKPKS